MSPSSKPFRPPDLVGDRSSYATYIGFLGLLLTLHSMPILVAWINLYAQLHWRSAPPFSQSDTLSAYRGVISQT
jgi:hypothetical protein